MCKELKVYHMRGLELANFGGGHGDLFLPRWPYGIRKLNISIHTFHVGNFNTGNILVVGRFSIVQREFLEEQRKSLELR